MLRCSSVRLAPQARVSVAVRPAPRAAVRPATAAINGSVRMTFQVPTKALFARGGPLTDARMRPLTRTAATNPSGAAHKTWPEKPSKDAMSLSTTPRLPRVDLTPVAL